MERSTKPGYLVPLTYEEEHRRKLGANLAVLTLNSIGLSAKIMSNLRYMGIVNLEHLLLHTADELLGWVSLNTLIIIRSKLNKLGLRLKGD